MAAPMQDNNIDLNNNGVPDKFEYKDAADVSGLQPQGNAFDNAYTSEEQIAKYIPDYKSYQWFREPNEGYFYSYGQKLENKIESGAITPEMLPEGSDIQKEAEQLYDNNPYNNEINNEAVNDTIKEINNDSFFDNFLEEQKAKIDEKPKVDNSLIEEQRAALELEENQKNAIDDGNNIVDFYDLVSEITLNDLPITWKDTKVDSLYKYYNKRMSKLGEGEQKRELYDKMIRSMMNEIQKHPEEYAEEIDNFEGSIGLSTYLGKAINYDTDSNWHTRQNLVDENELFDFSHNLFDIEKLKREGFTANQAFEISNDPLAYIATNNKGSEKLRAIWDEEAAKAGMPSYSDLVKEFSNQKDDAATFRNFAKGQISRDELINGLKEKGNYKAALVASKLSDKDLQNSNLIKYVMGNFRSRKSDEQNEKLIDDAVKEYKKGRTKELFDELGIDLDYQLVLRPGTDNRKGSLTKKDLYEKNIRS